MGMVKQISFTIILISVDYTFFQNLELLEKI